MQTKLKALKSNLSKIYWRSAAPQAVTLKDNTRICIRPVTAQDEPLLVKFHESLSEQSVYSRWFSDLPLSVRTSHDQLSHLWSTDPAKETVLAAQYEDQQTGEVRILGMGWLIRQPETNKGEMALIINDEMQQHGLGTQMLKRIIELGHEQKLDGITGDILPENRAMQRLCEKLGFNLSFSWEDKLVKAVLLL